MFSVSGSYSTYSAADSVKGEVWYENQSCLSLSGFSCIVESSFGLWNCILMEEDYSGHGLKKKIVCFNISEYVILRYYLSYNLFWYVLICFSFSNVTVCVCVC